jgi:hypothetical protein
VRALDGDDGEEVDLAAGFGDLDDGGEAGEASAYYDDSWGCCCHVVFPISTTALFVKGWLNRIRVRPTHLGFVNKNCEEKEAETCAHHLNNPEWASREMFFMQPVDLYYW